MRMLSRSLTMQAMTWLLLSSTSSLYAEQPDTGSCPMLFSIVIRMDVQGTSGIWFSTQGDPAKRPKFIVQYTYQGVSGTKTYQYGLNGMKNAYGFYLHNSSFESDGCVAAGLPGTGRECHKHEIEMKKAPERNGFFRCDLFDVPPGPSINQATLYLHLHTGEGLAWGDLTSVLGVYENLTDWDWDTAIWSFPWSNPGGDFGTKIRDIRAKEDMRDRGFSKGSPDANFDFTAYVQQLQAARNCSGTTTGGSTTGSGGSGTTTPR